MGEGSSSTDPALELDPPGRFTYRVCVPYMHVYSAGRLIAYYRRGLYLIAAWTARSRGCPRGPLRTNRRPHARSGCRTVDLRPGERPRQHSTTLVERSVR